MNNHNLLVRGVIVSNDDVPERRSTGPEDDGVSVDRARRPHAEQVRVDLRPPDRHDPPGGIDYWARLAAVIDKPGSRARFFMAMLKPLGIEKGKPFQPDARQTTILEEAAALT